jgi:predicted RNA binding protein YcfA (HicA-like mRNA interferase family)/predicted RNase H-like HicB family nuclease
MRACTAVVEHDPETGLYVGHVPGWPGAHSQGATLDELQANLQEAVAMLLDDGEHQLEAQFIGTQIVRVARGSSVSPRPPVLKAGGVIRLLERRGFAEVRQRGSHQQFRHRDGRQTTVPVHADPHSGDHHRFAPRIGRFPGNQASRAD